MTASAHIVTVGAMPSPATDGTAVAAALGAAGVAVVSRVFVEDDEGALERALGSDEALTVVLAGGGGSAGDIVRRVLARATGTRLVLNERVLAALQERYRRLDRPLPRRAERLALLPQGATVWVADDGESGWALVTGSRAFAVLPRDASVKAMIEQHLSPFARAWASGRGTTLVRTLRTAGLGLADVEERLADWLGPDGEVTVSTIPADGAVWVTLRARASTATDAARSAEGAEAMARGVAALAGTPCGLAIAGVAGPDDGTPARPVGTIFVGLVVKGEALARRFHFAGERAAVKWQATQAALDLLRRGLGARP